MSDGKVNDFKSGGPGFEFRNKPSKRDLLVLLDNALYLRVVLYNYHIPSDYYEYGMLKDLIDALGGVYTGAFRVQPLSRTFPWQ